MSDRACSRRWLGVLAVASVLCATAQPPVRALGASLCSAPEESYFWCRVRTGKLIELCGGKSVEYRFGKPGRVELSYPATPADGQLRFAQFSGPLTDRIEISFSVGGANYALFDYSEGKKRSAGVRATSARGKEITTACHGPIVSRLGALKKLLPCAKESALNPGGCP